MTLETSITKVIVPDIGEFLFDIEGTSQITLEADITDHYVEDNTAIQDHIALKPEKITLKGYQGEVVTTEQIQNKTTAQLISKLGVTSHWQNNLSTVKNTLSKYNNNILVKIFNPPLTQYTKAMQQAISTAQSINPNSLTSLVSDLKNGNFKGVYNALKNLQNNDTAVTTNIWQTIKNTGINSTRQQQAYDLFKQLWKNKVLVTVQTPFGHDTSEYFSIESVTAIQNEETKFMSDFQIILKRIRWAKTKTVQFDSTKYQSRTSQQASTEINMGKAQGKTVDSTELQSTFYKWRNNISGLLQQISGLGSN